MKKFLIIWLSGLLFLGSAAQDHIELFAVAPYIGLPAKYEAPYESYKAKPAGVLINLVAPIPFSETSAWYNMLTYTSFNIGNDAIMPAGIANPISLHSFIFRTGYFRKFGNQLDKVMFGNTVDKGLIVLFAPRFMTDFQNVNADNFQLGGIVLYQKIFSEKLFMRFGAMYHQEMGGPYLVPIVETDWRISSKWSIVGQWPIFGKINYHVNENFTTGISHFGLVTSYRLGHPDYAGDYIERTSIDLSIFGRQRVAGNFYIEGRVGYAVGRTYKQYSPDDTVPFRITILSFGDNRIYKNYLFDPGIVFNIRFVYDLPLI